MEKNKIDPLKVIPEGALIGLKNLPSLLGAVVLYVLTIWVPYINVGTTIAMASIPVALSQGKVISPLFIFEPKYRQIMGEYFALRGLKMMSLVPAFCFMIVPGIIISIGWSQALYLLVDKQLDPSACLTESNKLTRGSKWGIFGTYAIVGITTGIVVLILQLIGSIHTVVAVLMALVIIALALAVAVAWLGIAGVIYRNLTQSTPPAY